MKTLFYAMLAVCGLIFAAACGAQVGELGVVLAMAAPVPAMGEGAKYSRKRRKLPDFENIVATGTATCEIPRYEHTLFGATLYMSGTTFNESHITDIRVRLGGSKTLWWATGAHLRKLNKYKGNFDGNRQHLWVDFSQRASKSFGGEYVGGLDMSSFPEGDLTLEVTTSGATAPALLAIGHWGPKGSGNVMQKLLRISFSTSGTGRKVLPVNRKTFTDEKTNRSARVRRMFFIYAGTSWEQGTATSAAWSGNTGNGAMGTVTSTAGAQVGEHQIAIVEPGANVGTFLHFKPDNGNSDRHALVALRGVVASAYAGGGLSFTLADGATDFVSGDGFTLTVGQNTNGNVNRVEVIKDGEAVWDFECYQARELQQQYKAKPQSLMYVADFEIDGHADSSLKVSDANHMEVAAHFTAADSVEIYCECLDDPASSVAN